MRKGLAVAALILGILGSLAGLNSWLLEQYVLHLVNWEGPLATISSLGWAVEGLSTGLAVVLLAMAVFLGSKHNQAVLISDSPTPPPLPPFLPPLPATEKLEPSVGMTTQGTDGGESQEPPHTQNLSS